MTVKSIEKSTDDLTMKVTVELAAPVERAWEMWADPRLLEQWWGPPGYPSTFVEHDLTPGADVSYYMTTPEGSRSWGWWRIIEVDSPTLLVFEDGFGDDDGAPNDDMPKTTSRIELSAIGAGRTQVLIHSTFNSLDDMERMIAMGVEEGLTMSLNQIDALV
jgi:uncharacterized protein YndB with AHSA1/START domain